jgi:hypothetical protein
MRHLFKHLDSIRLFIAAFAIGMGLTLCFICHPTESYKSGFNDGFLAGQWYVEKPFPVERWRDERMKDKPWTHSVESPMIISTNRKYWLTNQVKLK